MPIDARFENAYPNDNYEVPFDVEPTTRSQSLHTVERYVRINVTKNTKGYNHEATVSVTTTAPLDVVKRELTSLLEAADLLAQQEIARQKAAEYELDYEHGN